MLTTLDYLDHVLVTKPGAGTVDPETGVFTQDPVTVLDAACDVQKGRSVLDTDNGQPRITGYADVWLPEGTDLSAALNVAGLDVLVTTRDGVELGGSLLETDYFDVRLAVAWT